MFIMELRRKLFQLLTKKKMKLFSIYLFCIALLTYHGLSMANNIKKDLLNQSNQINQAVTSYSQYLQTLN